jgi:hypothetical protein
MIIEQTMAPIRHQNQGEFLPRFRNYRSNAFVVAAGSQGASFVGDRRMADSNESASSRIGHEGAAREPHSTARTVAEPGHSVVAEFVDAARSAAESLLEEQKQQIADRVAGVAEALRCASPSLDQSQNRVIARYAQQVGDHVENIARNMRNRRWGELVADIEEFARRQPTWFVLGAVATGFLVGRLVWAPTQRSESIGQSSRGETTRAVTAAISSGSGTQNAKSTGAVETAGHGAGSSGGMGTR